MIIAVKNEKVIATHSDSQKITSEMYNGAEIISVPDGTEIGDDGSFDLSLVDQSDDRLILLMTGAPKLEIRRAMRSLGIEDKLDTLLTDETFNKDWQDAIEIDLSEEIVASALSQMEVDVDTIKREILKLRA